MTHEEAKRELESYFELAMNMAEALEGMLEERVIHPAKWKKGREVLNSWKGIKPEKKIRIRKEKPIEAESPVIPFKRPPAEYTNIGGREVVMKKCR